MSDRFATMTLGELIAISEGLGRAIETLHTVVNEPRCSVAVQAVTEDEIDRLCMVRAAAIVELEGRPADGTDEDRNRIGILAAYELNDCGADVSATLFKLQRMSAEHGLAAAKLRTPCGHRTSTDTAGLRVPRTAL